MKDLVSNGMLGGVALIAALAVTTPLLVSPALSWPAVLSIGVLTCLAAAFAYWRGARAPRSIAQIFDAVEAVSGPAVAVARAVRPREE